MNWFSIQCTSGGEDLSRRCFGSFSSATSRSHPRLPFWHILAPVSVSSLCTLNTETNLCVDYAIACAVPLALANYLMVGWFNDGIDQFYLTSWEIFVGMAVVFNLLSPLAFAMLRHRLGQKVFFWSVIETAKWTPMFVLFFGGISLHLSMAIFCHFFSIKMEWTATAKELETTGFRIGLDKIFKDFKYMYMFVIPIIGGKSKAFLRLLRALNSKLFLC